MEQYLNWDNHIGSVCNKLKKAYYCIKHLKNCPDLAGPKKMYYSMVHPHITINISARGKAREVNKKIIRLIYSCGHMENCRATLLHQYTA